MAMLKQGGTGETSSQVVDYRIERELDRAREKWMREAGLSDAPVQHFERPIERPFTRSERDHVTILFGGLTLRHDRLLRAAAEGLGNRVEMVPMPEKADFQAGKEFGNNGQCNPTYFTVGALVNHLKRLRDEGGLSAKEIIDNYVFMTAGACGPCRFGMYEAEYRLALRNSGFDGFRVLLFQQKGGMKQSGGDAGLDLNINFALALLNAFFIGDLLNEIAYQIRPYETEAGQTDRVFDKVMTLMEDRMRARNLADEHPGLAERLAAKALSPLANPKDLAKIIGQVFNGYYLETLRECRRMIDAEIEVDYTRPKPICKITGEFWAQTTEGDGNFRMFSFLESQGAEVLVEPLITWVAYLLAQESARLQDQRGLKPANGWRERLGAAAAYRLSRARIVVARRILMREYNRIRAALGDTAHEPVCQLELQRMGHPYYNRKSGGGEGHLEVAKNIYYATRSISHMVMSLKPFGCMPSTQSDGAQAAVTSHFPDMVYIPIETSGEGDINAHSRAQMALGEAKVKCKEEFNRAIEAAGYPIAAIREYAAARPELRRPLQKIPKHQGVAGKAANFVRYVAAKMDAEGLRTQYNEGRAGA